MKFLQLKVAEIDIKQLNSETPKSLRGMHAYTDRDILHEHFYHIESIQNRLDNKTKPLSKDVRDDLVVLKATLYAHHITYFRFVKN